MDKNAIKKYAVWARRELIERVSQRAMIYGITAKDDGDPNAESVNGHLLSQAEKRQRQALISQIKRKSYTQVMEEVAYTWFNRFAALRFMEVNGYLPTRVRIFTDDENQFNPQILSEAIHMDLEGLDLEKVYALKDANDDDSLFKYLLITQCNALSAILPGMFQRIEDYTELLLPDYLLREGSVIEQMVTTIPEEDWTDQVQIIGWLYQYYNTEPKDKVFADLKKNIKVSKENIPAATQLFTPDWIVHYMVENSLGRLWLEGHPNDSLKSEWKYYLDEAEQEPEVQAQLATIREEYAALKPEEIRVIDPCMGSGHILCVLFDVLVRIYEDYGYTAREAAVKIVEYNLWGLDIDERAAQLSYFAVMMKARQYDRRFFTRKVQPHVYAIEESNGITSAPMHDMGLNLSQEEYGEAVKQAMRLVEEMHDAKEYGSIIHVTPCDWDLLRRFAVPRDEGGQLHLDIHGEIEASARLQHLINIGETLSQKYHTVVTNPPYMGAANMGSVLSEFVKKTYPDTKSDLSTVFMEKTISMCGKNGLMGMINIPVWMSLSSFDKLRDMFVKKHTFVNMLHLGRGIFGADFGTTAFVIMNNPISEYRASYRRLFLKQGAVDTVEQKENWFFEGIGQYYTKQKDYLRIAGAPIAYWLSDEGFDNFERGISIDSISDFTGSQHKTADNDRFLRYFWELPADQIKNKDWIFYIKGGEFRKWYGNINLVVDWRESALSFYRTNPTSNMIKEQYWFQEGITYTSLTSSTNGFRYLPPYGVFDIKGPSIVSVQHLYYCLGFFNTKVAMMYLKLLNPTITLQVKDVKNTPIIIEKEHEAEIDGLVQENISLSKEDWDANETSWDFEINPIVAEAQREVMSIEGTSTTFEYVYQNVAKKYNERFHRTKSNEERLNELFVSIYHLEGEIDPAVDDADITVFKADLQRDIKAFISYAIGCMFGRYSIDEPGMVYASGEWDSSKYITFMPDKDAIIPICDDEYFADDIVGRFVKFVEVIFGKERLEENLRFIADALGGKGSSRNIIRSYFINDFYTDHAKMYQKCPIYWLFDSGKKNGFKCLIYMHRYQPDTIARIRTDYVHEQQSRYRTAIADLEQRINGASTSERVKLSKQLNKLLDQAEEIRVYEEKIHHLADQMIAIDLDDGVKHNYAIFQDVLAKIR